MKKLLICTLLGASLAACADAPTRLVGPDAARSDDGHGLGSGNLISAEGGWTAGSGGYAAGENGGPVGTGFAATPVSVTGGEIGLGSHLPLPAASDEIGTAGSGHAVHGGTRRGMQGRKTGEETTSSVVTGPVIAADGTCQTGNEIGTAGSGHIVLVPCT
ncbi:MAG TPA: hypothetical protein VFE05_15925 [Longimicrobiaceae bacterium]|jgi:hypothetical protein|nr:hypothetical protein [Longimicrobiaceae bacterium]